MGLMMTPDESAHAVQAVAEQFDVAATKLGCIQLYQLQSLVWNVGLLGINVGRFLEDVPQHKLKGPCKFSAQ